MRRLSSMKYAAAETRRILRDRFTRYLPATQSGAAHPNNGDLLRDEVLLKLLLNLQPVLEGAADRARASYDAALAKNPGEPSFDQAIADGWFRIVWGRV